MRNYKNIEAFKLSDELTLKIYTLLKTFPKDEIYSLTSQIRRAAVSIPANIAEGTSRQHKKEYLNFLYISRGSAAELEYLISLAKRIDYIKDDEYSEINALIIKTSKCLYFLIKSIENEDRSLTYSPIVQ